MRDAKELTMTQTLELKVDKTYRAKKPRRAGRSFGGLINDRTIIWMSVDGSKIQYDGPAIGVGSNYPIVSREKFLDWADRDVTEELPQGEYASWPLKINNVTFKPAGDEYRIPGGNTISRDWEIFLNGVFVGKIETTIRDLYQSNTTPGYSVTVTAAINGAENQFYKNSSAFSNRSAREARENRSSYINSAKEWAKKTLARATPPEHSIQGTSTVSIKDFTEKDAAIAAKELANYLNRGPITLADVGGLKELMSRVNETCNAVIEDAEASAS